MSVLTAQSGPKYRF